MARADVSAATKFIGEQPKDKQAMLKKVHGLVVKGMPDADVAIKWGIPVYIRGGRNVAAIAAFKEHIGLNFFVPPAALSDPKKKLEGGKTNRMLKIRSADEIKDAEILAWVKAAAAAAERK